MGDCRFSPALAGSTNTVHTKGSYHTLLCPVGMKNVSPGSKKFAPWRAGWVRKTFSSGKETRKHKGGDL